MVTNSDAYQDLQPIHHDPTSFAKKYLFTTDHKVIAKQFLWSGIVFLGVGGLLAMAIRYQWAYPGEVLPGGRNLRKNNPKSPKFTAEVLHK